MISRKSQTKLRDGPSQTGEQYAVQPTSLYKTERAIIVLGAVKTVGDLVVMIVRVFQ